MFQILFLLAALIPIVTSVENLGNAADDLLCDANIALAYDISSQLTFEEFEAEKEMIIDPFLSTVYPDHAIPVAVFYFASNSYQFGCGTKEVMMDRIDGSIQSSDPSGDLIKVLRRFSQLTPTYAVKMNNVIFTGSTLASDQVSEFNDLMKNIRGSTILIFTKPGVDATSFNNTDVKIVNYDPNPQKMMLDLRQFMNCSNEPSSTTTPSITPISSISTVANELTTELEFSSTTTPDQYLPCNSWISFSADISNSSSYNDFERQLQFISYSIGIMNHPERLQYATMTNVLEPWHNSDSIKTIQSAVMATAQLNMSFSLRQSLATVIDTLSSVDSSYTRAFIIFISDTRTSQNLDGGEQFAKNITSSGAKLTFVLMGVNTDPEDFRNYTTANILTWGMSNFQPDYWNDSVYNCPGNWTTPTTANPTASMTIFTKPTTTTSTTTTKATTTTSKTTTKRTTTTPTTTTSKVITKPATTTTPRPTTTVAISITVCEANIALAYDISTQLTPAQFNATRDMILDPFLSKVYPDDITPMDLIAFGEAVFPLRHNTKAQMVGMIQNYPQGSDANGNLIAVIEQFESVNPVNSKPVNYVIFTTSTISINQVNTFKDEIKKLQGTIILVDVSKFENVNVRIAKYNSNPQIMISDLRTIMNCN